MEYQRYGQYTSNYTNVIVSQSWHKALSDEQIAWLVEHEGGMYHIHRSGTAVKFERKEDAEWFVLRWL
jgi:hypothetical protein